MPLRVPPERKMTLEHFIPINQYRGEYHSIKPTRSFNLKDFVNQNLIRSFDSIWNASLDLAINVMLKAEKVNNADKDLTELIDELKLQKDNLIVDLDKLLALNRVQILFAGRKKKIYQLKDIIDQLSNQIKYLEKINKDGRACRQIKSLRNKVMKFIADKVS